MSESLKVIPAAMYVEAALNEISEDRNAAGDRAKCSEELEETYGSAGVEYPTKNESPDEAFKDGYYLGLRVAKVLEASGVKL